MHRSIPLSMAWRRTTPSTVASLSTRRLMALVGNSLRAAPSSMVLEPRLPPVGLGLRRCATHAAPSSNAGKNGSQEAGGGQQQAGKDDEIPKANADVSKWLFGSCALVGTIVVVGGITRLTESGLSIVEWKPIRGLMPPITGAQWDEEFAKYKEFPEFQQKPDMTLSEFKYIFFWEWFHRVLARSMGLAFAGPMGYFAYKGYFKRQPAFLGKLFGCLCLGGMQGALGWYMVRSGLKQELLDKRQKATVSAYRLAAHLTLAFTIFTAMLRMAFSLRIRPSTVGNPLFPVMARLTTATMFITAVSGAFVAGLDAGLLYCDTFPYMGESLLPPAEDTVTLRPLWRNLFENGTGAQLWHRSMAGTTTAFVLAMNLVARRNPAAVPLAVTKAMKGVNHALTVQVLLGFATLMTYVSTPVAALHQFNSLALLAMLVRLCATVSSRGRVVL